MPDNRIGPARVKVHAVHVTDDQDRIVRTHIQPGGRYHPHPLADEHGVIVWPEPHTDDMRHARATETV